ncbi:MAG TPA: nucleotide exchange factor GrpE [Candidatus Paceibacterota bacterium]|nr:nucleotide exchange factor GrpE [Candidatus Paceibacterota bacterium]
MSDEPNKINTMAEPELPAAEPSELEKKLAETEMKRDEYLAGWQRAKADFINYKKDEMARFAEAVKYGSEDLMQELMTVLDNFGLAVQTMEKAGPVEKGVYLIKAQVEDILKKRGLERIPVKSGDAFDPNFMESIAEVEGSGPPGSVADEIEAGYRLHEKVIRPVRVRLVKAKE